MKRNRQRSKKPCFPIKSNGFANSRNSIGSCLKKKPAYEFEIVPLLGEEFGLSKAEQKKLATAAAKANLEFYEQLVQQREKATKKVFQTLSKKKS